MPYELAVRSGALGRAILGHCMLIEAEPQIGNSLYGCLHGAFVRDVHRHDDSVAVHEVEPIGALAVSGVDKPCLADASHQVCLPEAACDRFCPAAWLPFDFSVELEFFSA